MPSRKSGGTKARGGGFGKSLRRPARLQATDEVNVVDFVDADRKVTKSTLEEGNFETFMFELAGRDGVEVERGFDANEMFSSGKAVLSDSNALAQPLVSNVTPSLDALLRSVQKKPQATTSSFSGLLNGGLKALTLPIPVRSVPLLSTERKLETFEEFLVANGCTMDASETLLLSHLLEFFKREPTLRLRLMTSDAIAADEMRAFYRWRGVIAKIEKSLQGQVITPFEKNLNYWKQLWRVVEMTDIVVEILDARDPLAYNSFALEAFVRATDPKKDILIIVNKSDFLSQQQRMAWKTYLTEQLGLVNVVFYSAKRELLKQQAKATNLEPQDPEEPKEETENEDSSSEGPESTDNSDDDEAALNARMSGNGRERLDEPLKATDIEAPKTSANSLTTVMGNGADETDVFTSDQLEEFLRTMAQGKTVEIKARKSKAQVFMDELEKILAGISRDEMCRQVDSMAEEMHYVADEQDAKVEQPESKGCRKFLHLDREKRGPSRRSLKEKEKIERKRAKKNKMNANRLCAEREGEADSASSGHEEPAAGVEEEEEDWSDMDDNLAAGGSDANEEDDECDEKEDGSEEDDDDPHLEPVASGEKKEVSNWSLKKLMIAIREKSMKEILELLFGRIILDEKDGAEAGCCAIGVVGFPNVGKSSLLNSLLSGTKYRTGVCRTPGKTKHLQTFYLAASQLILVDCPGLVFPKISTTKDYLIISNVISPDHHRGSLLGALGEVLCRAADQVAPKYHSYDKFVECLESVAKKYKIGDLATEVGKPGEGMFLTKCFLRVRSVSQEAFAEVTRSCAEVLAFSRSFHAGGKGGLPDLDKTVRQIVKAYCDGTSFVASVPPPTWPDTEQWLMDTFNRYSKWNKLYKPHTTAAMDDDSFLLTIDDGTTSASTTAQCTKRKARVEAKKARRGLAIKSLAD